MSREQEALKWLREATSKGSGWLPSVCVEAEHWQFQPTGNSEVVYRASIVSTFDSRCDSETGATPMEAAKAAWAKWVRA